ncbi:MAG: hypothetical protein L0Y35_08200 [Flammeovirgaceae bacterium]|nr:hypothetical protein [Flammeovirgaceae bacterium]
MKTNFLKFGIASFLVLSFSLFSCQDDEKLFDNENEEMELAQQASEGDDDSDDVLEVANDVEEGLVSGSITGRVSGEYGCATVTHNAETKTVTIDFGESCVGPYGRERSGKIIITYSGTLGDNVGNRIITFENYVVNNKSVSGEIELRDISVFYVAGTEEIDYIQNVKKLNALTITFPNGESVVYNGSRTRKWTGGILDGDITNNEYEITGEIIGTWSTGRVVTHAILSPIISHWSCRANDSGFARIDGKAEVTIQGFVTRSRSVNYAYPAELGSGVCDNQILITIGNRSFVVTEVD